jgi:hypothetical protein
MSKVIILPIAKQDIKEASVWYNDQQRGLGKRFTTHVRKKIHFLSTEPYASSIRYDEIRTAVMDVFPYMIHYLIDEPLDTIVIIGVLHTSRNPDIWKKDP